MFRGKVALCSAASGFIDLYRNATRALGWSPLSCASDKQAGIFVGLPERRPVRRSGSFPPIIIQSRSQQTKNRFWFFPCYSSIISPRTAQRKTSMLHFFFVDPARAPILTCSGLIAFSYTQSDRQAAPLSQSRSATCKMQVRYERLHLLAETT